MYEHDNRVVMTLDAGGTNFVFTAIRECKEVVAPIRLDAVNDNIELCLQVLVKGFRMVEAALNGVKPVAISFAFPGPADYEHGIIGDLPNFPCFRGGVAMGPFLADTFGIPVFINNDGNLFAYGEALAGALPEINAKLAEAGSSKRYRNLLGLTLGTGFGGGVVIDGNLLTGDNGCGGDVWLMRNAKYPDFITEESVSIRAVKRVYHEKAPEDARDISPKEIFQIAEGNMDGNMIAARESFAELGRVAADAIIHAIDIVDGIVVVGGGIANNWKYIFPAMVAEMNSTLGSFSGNRFPSLQIKTFDLTVPEDMEEFLKDNSKMVKVLGSGREVRYCNEMKTGVVFTHIGTSTAISLGAYAFALAQIDKRN
ncbi:MAG: ROK family protein [Bacteroidales bacterium]|nr:ROK family protein [Bacteroidales bacterium]